MLDVFLQKLPFFAIIGLGYVSSERGFFTAEATAYLTKFVFYFAERWFGKTEQVG